MSTRESSYDKSEREYVFPAPHSRLLHNARRSAEPRAITLVPLLFLVEPQRSLTIVIMTNQYGLLHRPRVPQPSFSAALEFLNTDPKHSPGKVPSQGSML